MQSMNAVEVVGRLWESFAARDWLAAGQALAADVEVEWPHSAERIRGRDNVIGVNADYPGDWSIRVLQLLGVGDDVASQVEVRNGDQLLWAASFFRVSGGRITHIREYWVDAPAEPPPAWRRRYTEAL